MSECCGVCLNRAQQFSEAAAERILESVCVTLVCVLRSRAHGLVAACKPPSRLGAARPRPPPPCASGRGCASPREPNNTTTPLIHLFALAAMPGKVIVANTPEQIPLGPVDNKITAVYWDICGLAQPIRYALALAGADFVDVRIEPGDANLPSYKQMWFNKKPMVGEACPFPTSLST